MSDTCEEDEAGEDRSGRRRAWRENRCVVYHVEDEMLIRILEGEVRPEVPGFMELLEDVLVSREPRGLQIGEVRPEFRGFVELLEVVPGSHEARGLQVFVFSMDFDAVPVGDIIPYGGPMPVTPAGPGSWRDRPPML